MNRMRGLFRRDETSPASGEDGEVHIMDNVDLEAATNAPATTPATGAAPSTTTPAGGALNATQQLSAFREMVGITESLQGPASSGSKGSSKNSRAAPNVGIYSAVVSNQTSAGRWYTIYSVLISGCLGLQVLVAAAITAMGAASINHSVITGFGAVNTAIAGFHTYLQGYGLPGRLKYYQDQWGKVRDTIEQRERDFVGAAVYNAPLPDNTTLASAIAEIEKLYNDTLAAIQANAPGSYNPAAKPSSSAGTSPTQPSASNPAPPGTEPPVQVAQPKAAEVAEEHEPKASSSEESA